MVIMIGLGIWEIWNWSGDIKPWAQKPPEISLMVKVTKGPVEFIHLPQ